MIITRQRLPFLFLLPYPYHYDTANYKAMTTLNTKKYKKQSIGGNFMDTQKSIEHFDYCYEKASSIFEEISISFPVFISLIFALLLDNSFSPITSKNFAFNLSAYFI